jgi:hypothetical protein
VGDPELNRSSMKERHEKKITVAAIEVDQQ